MFHTIEDAIFDLKNGKMIIVVDDENRENEGDLLILSDYATPEAINFMITHGKGLVCTTIEQSHATQMGLKRMTDKNTDPLETAFTISIDHIDTTTGISAYDRSYTIKSLVNHDATLDDYKQPGHVFPLIANEGGVLARNGHTEASVDLAKLANSFPSGVICEIIKEDGTMARLPDLLKMSRLYDLAIISIEELIQYKKSSHQTKTYNQ